jgi:hypothetical protein
MQKDREGQIWLERESHQLAFQLSKQHIKNQINEKDVKRKQKKMEGILEYLK